MFFENVKASNLLLNENFDDQVIDTPPMGSIHVYKNFSWIEASPPDYNLTKVGRGGSGYSFSGAQNVSAWIQWKIGQNWPTDQIYTSFWQRYANFMSTDPNENLKLFYPHFGNNGYSHNQMQSDDILYVSAISSQGC